MASPVDAPTATADPGARRPRRWWHWLVAVPAVLLGLAVLWVAVLLAYPWVSLLAAPTEHEQLDSYVVANGGRALVLSYLHGDCDKLRKPVVVEQSNQQVVVTVVYRQPRGVMCALVGYPTLAVVRLDAPLGDRVVYGERNDGVRTPLTPVTVDELTAMHRLPDLESH